MRFKDRFDRNKRQPSTRTQRIGFAFFWLIVLSYAYFVASDANWNTESHLYPAFAAVDHRTLNIDAYQQRLGDKSLSEGHYYSDKAPGLSLLAIPVYAALRAVMPSQRGEPYEVYSHMRYAIPRSTVYLRYAITYILVILPSAIFAVLFWLFLARFATQGWSLLLAATYALGTLAFPFSVRFYSHQLTAVLLFSAFMLLFLRTRHRGGEESVLGWTALAGGLAGYAAISEYPTLLVFACLLVYAACVSAARLRAAGAFALGALPAAAVCAAYNWIAFGGPFATGYLYTHSSLYRSATHGGSLGLSGPSSYGIRLPSAQALWEITFGTYRGIFLLCPVLLLFFAALPYMRSRGMRAELWLCVAIVAAYFLMDASHDAIVNGWSGGTSVGSRHLVPALPFMCFPLAFGLRHRAFRAALTVLGSVSVASMFIAVAGAGLFSMTDRNPIANEMLPSFFSGNIQPDWGNMAGLTSYEGMVPLFMLCLLLVSRLVWLVHRSQRSRVTSPGPLPEREVA